MNEERHAALLALVLHAGPLRPGLAERVERIGADTALAEALGAGASLLAEDPAPHIAAARRALTGWRAAGIDTVGVLDADYPANLRGVHDRPALLFLRGDRALLTGRDAVAVVGTRHPSATGAARARGLAHDLARAGRTVVSGLATGIDTAAHRAAVSAGGRTVAVLGGGVDHARSPGDPGLAGGIARDHALVSVHPPSTPVRADGLRARNGLISGLCRGTVIVEASVRSGTRVGARLALGHGRPVLLYAELLDQPWAAELARRPGVHVVRSSAEVLALTAADHDGLHGPTG